MSSNDRINAWYEAGLAGGATGGKLVGAGALARNVITDVHSERRPLFQREARIEAGHAVGVRRGNR